jgi:hypothetical protein
MEIRIVRERSQDGATFGVVFVDGQFFGFSLEDVSREVPGAPVPEWKVPGVTAIPSGRYPIRIAMSPRARREVPWLDGVPGFSHIQIHPLNRSEETEGCVGVGFGRKDKPEPTLLESRAACDALTRRIKSAPSRAWVTIENGHNLHPSIVVDSNT